MTDLIQVHASDQDKGINAPVTYSVLPGNVINMSALCILDVFYVYYAGHSLNTGHSLNVFYVYYTEACTLIE